MNSKDIPIFINNRNRLEYLKVLIDWLKKANYKNITVIDNDSTYPPLLVYYETLDCEVIKLGKNIGHLALWDSGIYDSISTPYYVYTDPDIVPEVSCPHDVVEVFIQALEKYKNIEKIGFGLKIDDLPILSPKSRKIIKWEKKFWVKEKSDLFYEAIVDTTFAVYRSNVKGGTFRYPNIKSGTELQSLRSRSPYLARHMPWYRTVDEFTEEDHYYVKNVKTVTHWTKADVPIPLRIKNFIWGFFK